MRLYFFIAALCLALVACQSPGAKTLGSTPMTRLEEDFFKDVFALYPTWGSSLGKREYDGELNVPDKTFRTRQMSFSEKSGLVEL